MNCLYILYRHDSGERVPFYVGIGDADRPFDMARGHRSAHALAIWAKHPHSRRVIPVESWDEACELERFLISEIGRGERGPLVNHTDGGEGCPGRKDSDETRAKKSAAAKGRPKSPEHRAKLRVPKSPEHRAAISASRKGRTFGPRGPYRRKSGAS